MEETTTIEEPRHMSKDMLAGMAMATITISSLLSTGAYYTLKIVKRNKEASKTILNDIIDNL